MDSSTKGFIIFFTLIFGIGLFYFGFETWGATPADGCDWWLDQTGFQDYTDDYQDCKDDLALGKTMMLVGGLMSLGAIPMMLVFFIESIRSQFKGQKKYDPNANHLTSGNRKYVDGKWIDDEQKKE